jgi:hypothetical protein
LLLGPVFYDFTFGSIRVTFQSSKEFFWGNISTLVVNNLAVVYVLTIWTVKNLSREWVARAVCNVIVTEDNDVLGRYSIFDHDFVSVVDVSLVTVVIVAI